MYYINWAYSTEVMQCKKRKIKVCMNAQREWCYSSKESLLSSPFCIVPFIWFISYFCPNLPSISQIFLHLKKNLIVFAGVNTSLLLENIHVGNCSIGYHKRSYFCPSLMTRFLVNPVYLRFAVLVWYVDYPPIPLSTQAS